MRHQRPCQTLLNVLLGLTVCTLPGRLPAQEAVSLTLTLTPAGAPLVQNPPDTIAVTSPVLHVTIMCRDVDCRNVEGRVMLNPTDLAVPNPLPPIEPATEGEVTLGLSRATAFAATGARFLGIIASGRRAALIPLVPRDTQAGVAILRSLSVAELLAVRCEFHITGDPYDHRGNRAEFAVTPVGEVLLRPGDVIDEDDMIAVTVIAAEQLLPRLTVRRSSEFRVATSVRIAGAEVRVKELSGIRRQAAGQPPSCGNRTIVLRDFAPGRGEFEIALRTDEDSEILGKVEFGVHPLYTGAFSFGIVRSALRNPRYGLVFNGADSVITEIEDPTRQPSAPTEESATLARQRILYGVFYGPFFGRRDIEKDAILIRPTIGFALNDISENLFLGGTATIHGAFSLLGGLHWGRVTTLDPQSGLEVGSAFDGSHEEIPTVKRWRGDLFLGVSLDLRAAAQFLTVAFGAAG